MISDVRAGEMSKGKRPGLKGPGGKCPSVFHAGRRASVRLSQQPAVQCHTASTVTLTCGHSADLRREAMNRQTARQTD